MRKVTILTFIFTSVLFLSGCFNSKEEIDVGNPNTWDKEHYKEGYKIVEKDLNEILNRNRNSVEPATILWGKPYEHNYVAEDTEGNYKITVLVKAFERYSEEQAKTTDTDYSKINKALNEKVDKALEKNEFPKFTVHDEIMIKNKKYIYHMDKDNNILTVENY